MSSPGTIKFVKYLQGALIVPFVNRFHEACLHQSQRFGGEARRSAYQRERIAHGSVQCVKVVKKR